MAPSAISSPGLDKVLVEDERAGHLMMLPSEIAAALERPHLVGGDDGAAAGLGALA